MLPHRLRLTRRTFPGREGGRLSSPAFSIVTTPSRRGGCAVVVSKAVVKSSAGRHLLKRRLLSLLAPFCRPDRALVVYARGPASLLSFKALSEELLTLLTRLSR